MRILIIRPSSMGDVVMASPVLRALKEGLGSPEIHWLIEPGLTSMLEANPYVDGVVSWEKAQWNALLKGGKLYALIKEMHTFRLHMAKMGYELALDLQGLFRSRLLAFLSQAKERIGFASKEPGGFFMTRLVSKGPDSTLMGSEYLYLMEKMGIKVVDPAPHLYIGEETISKAKALLASSGMDLPFFAVAPFTTRPQKHWSTQGWIQLGKELYRRFGTATVVLGGPQDRFKAEEMVRQAPHALKHLCGRATIMESAAIISMAQALIGVDTGLTHMGTALKRPTVALFGATCPYLKAPLNTTKVIYHKKPCSPCKRRPTCKGDYVCMSQINVGEIVTVLEELL